jgi:hypothetical protein
LVLTKPAKLLTFASENDMIFMNFHSDKNAILAVNATGTELHSTLALLSYLRLSTRPRYNIFALTQLNDRLRPKFLEFVSANEAELCVVFQQAVPHLDGFHLMLPEDAGIDRSNDVLDFVLSKGHEVGAYSVQDDRPTFHIIHSHEKFLNALASVVGEVYAFAVSDDIWAGVNAAAFVLGDFDFGISVQPARKPRNAGSSC